MNVPMLYVSTHPHTHVHINLYMNSIYSVDHRLGLRMVQTLCRSYRQPDNLHKSMHIYTYVAA